MKRVNAHFFNTKFGTVAIIWFKDNKKCVVRIIIPSDKFTAEERTQNEYLDFSIDSSPEVLSLADDIKNYCDGDVVQFDFSILNLKKVSEFHKKVYQTLFNTERGQTVSYGELAEKSGHFGASRAVGTAMKKNPFPFVIPCHRVICSDGSIGGFFGNIQMKKDLLKMEAKVKFK